MLLTVIQTSDDRKPRRMIQVDVRHRERSVLLQSKVRESEIQCVRDGLFVDPDIVFLQFRSISQEILDRLFLSHRNLMM